MDFVFFPDHLATRSPGYIGNLCIAPSGQRATLTDVTDALQRRDSVSIRQASEAELKRAEALASLFEIGVLLGQKLETLLDQDAPPPT